MITFHTTTGTVPVTPGDGAPETLPAEVVWIDLLQGDDAETAFVERLIGQHLPNQHRLAEVETSSRLSTERQSLVMSSPILYRDEENGVLATPVGFVLGPKRLITLRRIDLKAFSDYAALRCVDGVATAKSGAETLLGLLETIVDRMADGMEAVGADLDEVSRRIFADTSGAAHSKPSHLERKLTRTLQVVGRSGETTAHARDSLLGLSRLMGYMHVHGDPLFGTEAKAQLETIRQDVASLNDYQTHLTDKVQFLLDSTLGFINIQQNRTFKLLTIASVIGIPPTFVVGLYGMNFKTMPEYDWSWGYQYGLVLIVLSIVVPIVWLRLKGWF